MRLFGLALIFKYYRPIILMWAALLLLLFCLLVTAFECLKTSNLLKAETNEPKIHSTLTLSLKLRCVLLASHKIQCEEKICKGLKYKY